MDYQDINAQTIDRWIEEGWEWGIPIDHETYEKARNGQWDVLLTPTKPVPKAWFGGPLKGKKILGLASGGGQQMPVFAACGADCTVLDYSLRQLESERMVAQREGYQINIVRADMTKPFPFEDESFDLIFHPVANCYVREIQGIWNECFRVLKKGGRLLAAFDTEICYAIGDDETTLVNKMPFDPLTNETYRQQLEKNDDGMQFSHTLEEEITGQLRAGFTLLDLYEDLWSSGHLRDLNFPAFVATLSEKAGEPHRFLRTKEVSSE